jgi:hypothetical protein
VTGGHIGGDKVFEFREKAIRREELERKKDEGSVRVDENRDLLSCLVPREE